MGLCDVLCTVIFPSSNLLHIDEMSMSSCYSHAICTKNERATLICSTGKDTPSHILWVESCSFHSYSGDKKEVPSQHPTRNSYQSLWTVELSKRLLALEAYWVSSVLCTSSGTIYTRCITKYSGRILGSVLGNRPPRIFSPTHYIHNFLKYRVKSYLFY